MKVNEDYAMPQEKDGWMGGWLSPCHRDKHSWTLFGMNVARMLMARKRCLFVQGRYQIRSNDFFRPSPGVECV